MNQHHVAAERLRVFYLTFSLKTRRGGRTMQVCLVSSTSGPTSFGSGLHVYIFIYSGEVCGRYADDARLIRASVTAPTSVVGSHSKLPSSVIILINGRLFSLGSRVCISILTLQFWHHTNYHSILITYPPHAVTSPSLRNLPYHAALFSRGLVWIARKPTYVRTVFSVHSLFLRDESSVKLGRT
jgi:hypothetical protein